MSYFVNLKQHPGNDRDAFVSTGRFEVRINNS